MAAQFQCDDSLRYRYIIFRIDDERAEHSRIVEKVEGCKGVDDETTSFMLRTHALLVATP